MISYKYTYKNNTEYTLEYNRAYRNKTFQSDFYQWVVRKYDSNNNMIEQITYDLNENDTIFHDLISQKYDSKNRLLKRIDSAKMLKIGEFYEYNNDRLNKSSSLMIYSNRDSIDHNVWHPIDSSLSVSTYFYKDTICIYRKTINWEYKQLPTIPDTLITYLYHDKYGNMIKSITIHDSDTFRIEHRTYNDDNNELTISSSSPYKEFNNYSSYKYDNKGNKIEETDSSSFFMNRTETKFNSLNKPISRKWVKLK